jgi:nitric oxide reductase activation protein
MRSAGSFRCSSRSALKDSQPGTGEEIDLNAAIEAFIDRKAGQSPSEKIYIEKNRKDRDFSTLFLLDMSASTDEWVNGKDRKPEFPSPGKDKKIIDIEKESLVVMAEALKEIGDEYAIYGFSGYGRREVDFTPSKISGGVRGP